MQLRRWGHSLFAAGYCAAATATALLLVLYRPHTDVVVAVLAGAVVVLAGALVQEVVRRRAAERKLHERQIRMRQAYEDLVEMILKLRPPKARAEPPRTAEDPAAAAAKGSRPSAEPAAPSADGAVATLIREALAEDRVEAFLQPIVGLPARKPRFFEVLSRLRRPDGTLVLPDQYLAVAERERLLPAIDDLCLGRATQLIRETDRRQHAIGFFCNVSAATLADPAFVARFVAADAQALRSKLVFEVSQHDLAADRAPPLRTLAELAEAGFGFSLDRVGSLEIDVAALVRHHVRYLKLNCAFFIEPETRSAVMELRRRLEDQPVEVIVEKIETERQLYDLEDLGLELAQGYLFGEPRLSRRLA
ncbi:MAG: EAL domain-containing protein [Rhodospirillaceae bacterium]